ncbi:hypothetical protein ACW9H0_28475, partial [Pseudomonas monsensis]
VQAFLGRHTAIASRLTPTVLCGNFKNVYTRMSPSVPFMFALFCFHALKSYIPPENPFSSLAGEIPRQK